MSLRRAYEFIEAGRSTIGFQSIANDRPDIRLRIRDLASSCSRYDYRRLLVLLQREGIRLNPKLMYRPYREVTSRKRCKRTRRRSAGKVR